MKHRPTLLYVTPHAVLGSGLPTRPALLLDALAASQAFAMIVVVNRLRPVAWLLRRVNRTARVRGEAPTWADDTDARLVEHPWPFGPLERWALRRLAESLPQPLVAWIADPKSAELMASLSPGTMSVLDAYDAWDRSPLVVGDRRLRAIRAGYRAAAEHATLVFANTPAMADRLRDLGARDVRLLPNGAPPVEPMLPDTTPSLVYVGRIHERFSTALVAAAADAVPQATIALAGPVERRPNGWEALVARPNVKLIGPVSAREGRRLMGRSRGLLVPHPADDYTSSQDAMKAWDALSVGAPVLSTSVPPAIAWPLELAIVADDASGFASGATRLVAGGLDGGREARLSHAATNGWDARAATAVDAILEVAG